MAGVAIGLPGALVSTRVLASQLYGVSARDPLTVACASALLPVVAVLAACVPALDGLRVDAVVALKHEEHAGQGSLRSRAPLLVRTGRCVGLSPVIIFW